MFLAAIVSLLCVPAVSRAVDPTIAAVGDMACAPTNPSYNAGDGTSGACRQRYVSDLVANLSPAALLDLGDNQYDTGDLLSYQAVYHSTFGRANNVVYPALGNAEYQTHGGQGFFDYFASAGVTGRIDSSAADASNFSDGYYSFDIGSWHLIALNSNCGEIGGCYTGSSQERWLKKDLAAHPDRCTLAYWHHPRWNSGYLGNDTSTSGFWTDLYKAHADVVLNGHANHHYERSLPQNPAGAPDSQGGLRQFIVSTGGESHGTPPSSPGNPATTQITNYSSYGILRLTLHADSYNWQFMPEVGGSFTDSGSGSCHWATAQAPAAPTLSATSGVNTVHLSWAEPPDGGAIVSSYKIYRGTAAGGEVLLRSVGNVTSYDDNTPASGTRYYYRVAAVNRVGEGSRSNEVAAAQAPGPPSLSTTADDATVHLSWAPGPDGGAPISSYKVYRGTAAGSEVLLKSVGNVTSYDDSSALNGKRYYYRLTAANSVGQGSMSSEVSATPAPPPSRPSLTATAGNGTVHLSWAPPSDGGLPITSYKIYRGESAGRGTLLVTVANVTSLDDGAVTNGVTYYYRVAAVNSIGEGSQSPEALARPVLPFVPAPVIDNFGRPVLGTLVLAPRVFQAARPGARSAQPTGTQVSYTLSGPAVIAFSVERTVAGVKRAHGCVRRSARARHGKYCTVLVRLRGSFKHTGAKGQNRFCFTGRVAGRRLARGSYWLVAEQPGLAAGVGKSQRSRFWIARRAHGGKGSQCAS